MPKYYVQSAARELITTATDPRAAAIWAVHRTLAPSLAFLGTGDSSRSPSLPAPSLGESISVSQRGYSGTDQLEFQTLSIVAEWTQLLVAVDRLQGRLAQHC